MNKLEQNLSLLEEKIVSDTDFLFLSKIKNQLAFTNPYFLVCLSEVIHQHGNSNIFEELETDTDMLELLVFLNEKAKKIYLNSNISEHFLSETELF